MAGAKLEKTRWPGIYRRGERYVYEWTDAHGKRPRATVRTIEEARREKARREEEARRGGRVEDHRLTFAEYARAWVDRYQGHGRRGVRDNTRDDYRRDLEKYAIEYFGLKLRLVELTPRHIADFVGWLCQQPGRRGPTLSDSSVRRALCPVRSCLESAVRENLIAHNPSRGAALPHRPQLDDDDDQDEVRALSTEQLHTFLAIVHPGYRTLFAFLAATGLRISEAEALEWRHLRLDGDRPVVKVRRARVRGRLGPPKSKHGKRDVPLGVDVVDLLRGHRSGSEWARPGDYVFATRAGTPLHRDNVRARQLKPAAEEAGAAWAGFHTFRHTCASRLFAGGRNAVQVQRWLGHHSPNFTLSIYVHLLDDDLGEPLALPTGNDVAETQAPGVAVGSS